MFDHVLGLYSNVYADCLSTFSECSYDSANDFYVVVDSRVCFCFDKIRDREYDGSSLRPADSLYFARNSRCSIFVEFKNAKMKGALKGIATKAADSLFMHLDICSKNGLTASGVPMHYLAVFSHGKNVSKSSRFAATLYRSGQKGGVMEVTRAELLSLYHNELSSRHPQVTCDYGVLTIILSEDFSRQIDEMD